MNKTIREIVSLCLSALLITFILSVFGVGFSLQITRDAFGESKILRWTVYLFPIALTWYFVRIKVFKKFNLDNAFRHSVLVYLFLAIMGSFLIKFKVKNPLYYMQQDYLAYTSESKTDVDNAIEVIRSNPEYPEPVVVPSDNYVIYKTDEDAIPDRSEESDVYVSSTHFAYWQTPVLLGYIPHGKLASDISFYPMPIKSVKEFFRYLIQIAPVYYLELLQKSIFSLAFVFIALYCVLLYYFLRYCEGKKIKPAGSRLKDNNENKISIGKYSWSNKKVPDRLLQLFRKMYQNPNMTEEEVTRKLEKVADSQLKQKDDVSK